MTDIKSKPAKRYRTYKVIHSSLVVLVICTVVLLSGCSRPEPAPVINSQPVVEKARPLTRDETILNMRYDQVAYPTTHNAMSNAEEGWMLPNQATPIKTQLDDGIRALMIDIHLWKDNVVLSHGGGSLSYFGSKPLVDELRVINTFLVENPLAVITLILENYVTDQHLNDAFTDANLVKWAYVRKHGERWPKLKTMVDLDKRLVILSDRTQGTLPWVHRLWDQAWETHFEVIKASDFSTDMKRGKRHNDLVIFNHFLSDIATKDSLAKQVNGYDVLMPRARNFESTTNRLTNFITVDYYTIGDLFQVVDELNQSRLATTATAN